MLSCEHPVLPGGLKYFATREQIRTESSLAHNRISSWRNFDFAQCQHNLTSTYNISVGMQDTCASDHANMHLKSKYISTLKCRLTLKQTTSYKAHSEPHQNKLVHTCPIPQCLQVRQKASHHTGERGAKNRTNEDSSAHFWTVSPQRHWWCCTCCSCTHEKWLKWLCEEWIDRAWKRSSNPACFLTSLHLATCSQSHHFWSQVLKVSDRFCLAFCIWLHVGKIPGFVKLSSQWILYQIFHSCSVWSVSFASFSETTGSSSSRKMLEKVSCCVTIAAAESCLTIGLAIHFNHSDALSVPVCFIKSCIREM